MNYSFKINKKTHGMNQSSLPYKFMFPIRSLKRFLHGFAVLPSRKFIKLEGNEAGKFLQGLTTNDILKLAPSQGQYSSLLNPQGRIMYDIFVYDAFINGSLVYLIECDGQIQERVYLHLETYNLRGKTVIKPVEDDNGIKVVFSSIPLEGSIANTKDSRAPDWAFNRFVYQDELTMLAAVEPFKSQEFSEGRYHRERIIRGIPEGAYEIASRQSIPLEYNIDLMGGIDFHKGCYIGQELVYRTHNRGVVRKRILPLRFHALNADTLIPERSDNFLFDANSILTKHLDKQNEFLPTELEVKKLKILSTNDYVGRLVMAHGNIGLGMMRLDSLKTEENRRDLATLDHVDLNWILADAILPDWWPKNVFDNI